MDHIAIAALGQSEFGEVFGLLIIALHAQGEITILRFNASGRQLDVFATQRGLDIRHRQSARRQRLAIEPDAHRIALASADHDPGNALDGRQSILHITLGVVAQSQ